MSGATQTSWHMPSVPTTWLLFRTTKYCTIEARSNGIIIVYFFIFIARANLIIRIQYIIEHELKVLSGQH